MSEYDYAWEKLHLAVCSLAGTGDQRERLVNAVLSLVAGVMPDHHLPPEIRSEFEQFMEEITSVDAKGDEGTLQATVDTLDEIGVQRAVDKILSFYDTISRHQEPY